MSRGNPLTRAQVLEIAELREKGLTYGQIARRFGVSSETVGWHCLKEGAEAPKGGRSWDGIVGPTVMKRGNHEVRRYTPEEDQKLLTLAKAGKNKTEIGRVLGRRNNSINGRLLILARRDARAEAAHAEG